MTFEECDPIRNGEGEVAKTKMTEVSEADILEAGFALFAEQGYARTSMADVAERVGTDLATVRRAAPDRLGLIDAMSTSVDRAVLSEDAGFSDDESVRDRLFDLLMRRFDGYRPYRDGLRAASSEIMRDPMTGLYLMARLGRAMAAYLDEAGVGTRGPVGLLRIKALSALWLKTARTFLDDDSEDLSKTMAELDKDLAQAERAAGWFGGARGRTTEDESPSESSVS